MTDRKLLSPLNGYPTSAGYRISYNTKKELTNHKPAPRNSLYISANSPHNDRSRSSASEVFIRHVSIAIALVTRRKDGPIEAPINDDVMNDSFVPRRHHGSILRVQKKEKKKRV